jgi:hypothetical protein
VGQGCPRRRRHLPRNRLLTRAGGHFLGAVATRLGHPADRGPHRGTVPRQPRRHRRAPQPAAPGPPRRTQPSHARVPCGCHAGGLRCRRGLRRPATRHRRPPRAGRAPHHLRHPNGQSGGRRRPSYLNADLSRESFGLTEMSLSVGRDGCDLDPDATESGHPVPKHPPSFADRSINGPSPAAHRVCQALVLTSAQSRR